MKQVLIGWVGTTSTLAITEIIEAAKEGGTLGGQALLFAGLIVLGWVIIVLHKSREASVKAMVDSIIQSNAAQRQDDRLHHEEVVDSLRQERIAHAAANTKFSEERGQLFQLVMKVASDSAVALRESAEGSRQQAQATASLRETLHSIRDTMHADSIARELRNES